MTDLAGKIATPLCAAGALALIFSSILNWSLFAGPGMSSEALEFPGPVLIGFALVVIGVVATHFARGVRGKWWLGVASAALVLLVAGWAWVSWWGAVSADALGPKLAFPALVVVAAGAVVAAAREPRLRAAALLGVGAGALFASTFFAWYSSGIEGAYFDRSVGEPAYALVGSEGNAWTVFRWIDLLIVVVVAVAVVATRAVLRRARDAAGVGLAAAGCAVVASGLVIWRSATPPEPGGLVGSGPFVALAALAVVVAGGLLAARAATPAR